MNKPIAIDLFCGAGGMSEGILQAGFHIVYSSDKSQEAGLTYKNRHEQLGLKQGINTYYESMDIRDVTGKHILEKISSLEIYKEYKDEYKEIDAIFGGPPCQGFSRAGLRKENDPRNFLFREYLRVVNEIKPKYVIMENVVGLLDTKLVDFQSYTGKIYKGEVKVIDILEAEFPIAGYRIKDYGKTKDGKIDFKKLILTASDFGVPQDRKRIIIKAYRNGEKEPLDIKQFKIKEKVTIEEALADQILDKRKKDKVIEGLEKNHKLKYLSDSKKGRTPGLNGEPIVSEELKNCEQSNNLPYVKERFSLFKEGESAKNVKDRFLNKKSISYSTIPSLLFIHIVY